MHLPDPQSLQCFVAAAERLNFRMAAGAVALSPAAFGVRIKALEDQVGAPLFRRTTRSVSLTTAGVRLVPQARRALEEARKCLSAASHVTPYALTLGTRYELGLSWLTPALDDLATTRPERTIHLAFGDSADLLSGVLRGTLDGFVSSTPVSHAAVRAEVLHLERYVLVAAPSLLTRTPLRRAEDSAQLELLDLRPELPLFRYFLEARPPSERWGFKAMAYLGTIAAVRQRVLAGAGVAVLPQYFVAPDLKTGALRPLFPRATLQHDVFRLAWRVGHPLDEALVQLAAELRALPLR